MSGPPPPNLSTLKLERGNTPQKNVNKLKLLSQQGQFTIPEQKSVASFFSNPHSKIPNVKPSNNFFSNKQSKGGRRRSRHAKKTRRHRRNRKH